MTPETFSTQPLRSLDQFEAWREWHQPVLEFVPQRSTRYGFPAEVHLWKLGGLAMSPTSVPPVSVARRKSNLRRDPIDHWVISYCVGRTFHEQGWHRGRGTCEGALSVFARTTILA
jgi:hypothetical protein